MLSKIKRTIAASLLSGVALIAVPAIGQTAGAKPVVNAAAATRSRLDELQAQLKRESARADAAEREVAYLRSLYPPAGIVRAADQPAPATSAKPVASPGAPRPRLDVLQAQLKGQSERADAAMKEVERLHGELKIRDELVALGIQRNAELTALAQEVIDKGVSTSTWEPFLQSHRVEMENLKQSYEDRVRAARIFDTTLAPSVEKRMQEELARSKAEAQPAAKN